MGTLFSNDYHYVFLHISFQSPPSTSGTNTSKKNPNVKPLENKNRENFKEFLSNSFSSTGSLWSNRNRAKVSNAEPPQNKTITPDQAKDTQMSNNLTVVLPNGNDKTAPPSPQLDSIDLNDVPQTHKQEVQGQGQGHRSLSISQGHRSLSPHSEFEDPDHRGRSGLRRRARDFLSSSFNGLLIMIPGFKSAANVTSRFNYCNKKMFDFAHKIPDFYVL